MLKDALKEEHELELQTLTEEKTLKWRFELNKLDHEITSAGTRLADAKERKHQADMDLGAMQQEKKELEDELARLRLQLEAEAADEAYNPNVLDELIKELEALVSLALTQPHIALPLSRVDGACIELMRDWC